MSEMGLDDLARSQIQRWLETTGETQTSLAQRIGRNQAWMSRYLAGEFNTDLPTLEKMAAVFHHTLAALLSVPSDPDEARLLANYRACRADARRVLLAVSAEMARPTRPRGRTGARR